MIRRGCARGRCWCVYVVKERSAVARTASCILHCSNYASRLRRQVQLCSRTGLVESRRTGRSPGSGAYHSLSLPTGFPRSTSSCKFSRVIRFSSSAKSYSARRAGSTMTRPNSARTITASPSCRWTARMTTAGILTEKLVRRFFSTVLMFWQFLHRQTSLNALRVGRQLHSAPLDGTGASLTQLKGSGGTKLRVRDVWETGEVEVLSYGQSM